MRLRVARAAAATSRSAPRRCARGGAGRGLLAVAAGGRGPMGGSVGTELGATVRGGSGAGDGAGRVGTRVDRVEWDDVLQERAPGGERCARRKDQDLRRLGVIE